MRTSRLGLTWANGDRAEGCPRVKGARPALCGGWVSGSGLESCSRRPGLLAVPAGVGFGDGEAEFFEFGDELAEPFVVVEPGRVVGGLVVGEDAGGGLAV